MGELKLESAQVDLDTGTVHRGAEVSTLTPSAHQLLCYFAEHPMETLSRELLLVSVWGYDGATLTRTVDTTVSRLRALLERDPAQPRHLITVHGAGYRFVPWATAPPEAAAMVLGSCTVALGRLQASWPDGRVLPLTAQEVGLLRALLAARGQPVSRSALLRKVWQVRGSRSTRSVDNAVMRLRAKLEAEPSKPRFLKTVRGAGYLLLVHTPAPAAPPSPAPTAPAKALLGRGTEQARLQALLAAPGLVTLLGTGGVGKTSLAQATARTHGTAFFCDLSLATDLTELIRGVAAGLSIAALPPEADAQIAEVGRQLSMLGPALVVLDNLEQLVAPAQTVLPRWLAQAPALRVLVTSRHPLQVAGEQVFPLEPLALADAAALFRARYAAAGGCFEKSAAEDKSIAALVTQLDRLPLAIELAAARGRLMRPAGLLARMDQRLRLLRSRGAGRHATLEAAIAWSWDLLDEHEQHVLAWCSVFRGFSLEAAEEAFPDGPDILDTLEQLIDHSLLRTEAVPGLPGEIRFRMLDSVRAFADKKLPAEARTSAQAAHAAYFAALARDLLRDALLQGEPETFRRLKLEVPNFLAAIENRSHEAPEQAAWNTLAVASYLGPIGERATLQQLLSELSSRTSPALRRQLQRQRAILLLNQQEFDESRAILEPTIEGAPPTLETAQLLGTLGTVRNLSGDLPGALESYQRGAALAARHGANGLAAMLTAYEGSIFLAQGDLTRAAQRSQSAALKLGPRGSCRERGFVFGQLGRVMLQQASYGHGIHCLRQAIAAMDALDEHGNRCLFQAGLIVALWMDNQPEAAEAAFQAIHPLPERHLTQMRRTFVLLMLGEYLLLTGRYARAAEMMRQCLDNNSFLLGVPRMWLSVCEAFSGRTAESRALFEHGSMKPRRFPYDQPVFVETLAAWRAVAAAETPAAISRGHAALKAGRASPLFGLVMDFRAALRGLEAALRA